MILQSVFQYDARLGIAIPLLNKDWESLSIEEQEEILWEWETIREAIPDRIKELEALIVKKQKELDSEEDFYKSCNLNTEISELASVINDLHLWFRLDQDLTDRKSVV